MKSIAARLDALEKTVGDRDATITELTKANETAQEELAKAQARVAELEAMPAAGGPASTAAAEGDGKLGKEQVPEDAFAKSADAVRQAEGQREQTAARRAAASALPTRCWAWPGCRAEAGMVTRQPAQTAASKAAY
jgi:uncharacterized coiled-coil protein SlyX